MQTSKVSKKQTSVSKMLNKTINAGEKANKEWLAANSTFVKGADGEEITIILSGTFEMRSQVFSPDRPAVEIIDLDCYIEGNETPKIYSHPCFPMPAMAALTRKLAKIFAEHEDNLTGVRLLLKFGKVGNAGKIGLVDLKEVM